MTVELMPPGWFMHLVWLIGALPLIALIVYALRCMVDIWKRP